MRDWAASAVLPDDEPALDNPVSRGGRFFVWSAPASLLWQRRRWSDSTGQFAGSKVSARSWGKVIHHGDGQVVLDPVPWPDLAG